MSSHVQHKRHTAPDIQALKGSGRIVSLTAYTSNIAKLMDHAVELIIVGDSVAMVAYGFDSTLPVTLDMMIQHGAAVVRGTNRACVIVDLPFGSYQESKQQAYRNASRVMRETGAQGVKLEAGFEMVETVQYLVERGIPVMPHIGLRPQHAQALGGFKVQAKDTQSQSQLCDIARAFEQAGAFSVLVEGVYRSAANQLTDALSIPVIGIGASPNCDGQVLVTEDLLGLFSEYQPKFAKQYLDLSEQIKTAFEQFRDEVKGGLFPSSQHCYGNTHSVNKTD